MIAMQNVLSCSADVSAESHLTKHGLNQLVHDLRQPLSTIEAIACYLQIRLVGENEELRSYVGRLQDVVEEAHVLLSRVAETAH